MSDDEPEKGRALQDSSPGKAAALSDVIGGHGPWQFRCWSVFFLATCCIALQLAASFPLSGRTACCCCGNSTFPESAETPPADSSSPCNSSRECILRSGYFKGDVCAETFLGHLHSHQGEFFCSHIHLVIYSKCIFVMGCLASAFATFILKQRFGRRPLSFASGLLLFVSVVAASWARDNASYLVIRFAVAVWSTTVYLMAASSLSEFVGAEYCNLYWLIGHAGWGLAHLILPLVTWLTGTWLKFNLVLTAFTFALLVVLSLIPESLDSFAEKGLWCRANDMLQAAARSNGCHTTDDDHLAQKISPSNNAAAVENEHLNFLPCTRENSRAYLEIVLRFLTGFLTSLQYFVMMWLTDWYTKQRGSYFSLLGTTEIAAIIFLLFLTCFFSMKRLWGGCMVLSSLSMLVMYFKAKNEMQAFSTYSYLATMFFSAGSWTLLFLTTVQWSFKSPKSKRDAVIFGVSLCIGQLAASTTDLQKFENWCPLLLLVCCIPTFFIGLITTFIPDSNIKVIVGSN